MKRGQLLGQPLVYLFAIIMGALILAWGISSVIKLQTTAEKAELAKFVIGFESEVDKYLNFDEGSSNTIRVALPRKIEYICFYDSNEEKDCKLDGKSCNIPSLDEGFATMTIKRTKYNLFFLPYGVYNLPPRQIKNLKIEQGQGNPLCLTNNQRKELVLTSMGSYVAVGQ